MINAIIASAAMMAGVALAQGAGSATVVNSCSYPVHLANTPAANGGYSEIDQILSSGGSYSQPYTELTNGMGWSLKLSKSSDFSNIMQYEYTFHNDGTIWFDLSDVNGNPWDGDWEITATGDCTPKQSAYRFATDDAYGMQSCGQSSSVTVTLCSGDGSSGSGSGSNGSSAASPSQSETEAPSPTSTYQVPSTTTSPAYSYGGKFGNNFEQRPTSSPSTFATQVTSHQGGVTITNIATQVVTQYVTATAPAKRHEHHPRHAHNA